MNRIPAKHAHRARGRFGQPEKQLDSGSFASAVRSEERNQFASSNGEVDLAQSLYFAEGLAGSVQAGNHRPAIASVFLPMFQSFW